MRGFFFMLTCVALVIPGAAFSKIKVAASIPDLASIASSVGGDQVECFAIAKATADAHRVEVLPSYMVKVSKANVYLKGGLGLDQWSDAIIDGSRNDKLAVVDCSAGVNVLEKPAGAVDASMGDVHPNGNPHYWLDPRNGGVIARTIAEALGRVDPAHAADYQSRAEQFAQQCDAAYAADRKIADAIPNRVVFTYHRSWPYFANAFGFEIAGQAEPVPGIPPTARHLADLVSIAKSRKIAVLIQEPYFSADAGKFLQREAGVQSVVMPLSCDSAEAGSYLAHIDAVLKALAAVKGES
ncbi:MAG TPA: metal ABC transporter substrate-binding protein [Candidatus Krumholzibacteria bacterium]|nr:metal ABC transporter substrate-binding protein [Candidatus Krumholzibacteria bacterium]